ncbi:hypothetical protein [Gilliamella bombi]|uniref:hypothetical protein n=1 Tax=Gilliamella bombi TaxID=1908521 RepID=UPI000A15EDC7|nr:hypothetical protein [Gilliamella bombi]
MKNFTIKKVALGLFLAGYAASSAFAIGGTTQRFIEGNAPVMKASSSAEDHTMAVSFKRGGNLLTNEDTLKVGDTVHIQYQLVDADGDTDTLGISKSLQVFVKEGSEWKPVDIDASKPTYSDDGVGEISFTITNDFVGKTQIGFKILERTDFGYPVANQWLTVSDIFANGEPSKTPADPYNPGKNDPGNPGNPAKPTGPGQIDPGNIPRPGPIEPEQYQVYIYKLGEDGNPIEGRDYTKDGSKEAIPKYGEKFTVVVKDTATGKDLTQLYTYEWYVTGNYLDGAIPAEPRPLPNAYNRVEKDEEKKVHDAILLGSDSGAKHNSIYNEFTTHKAGIQGYKLEVRSK